MNDNNKKRNFAIIVVLVITLLIIIIAFSLSSRNSGVEDNSQTTNTEQQTASEPKEISQNDAEMFCQDISLLNQYIDTNDTDIIMMSNYNLYFIKDTDFTSTGESVHTLQWNGNNKSDNRPVLFICDISGTSDNITLHQLTIDGTTVYGPVDMSE